MWSTWILSLLVPKYVCEKWIQWNRHFSRCILELLLAWNHNLNTPGLPRRRPLVRLQNIPSPRKVCILDVLNASKLYFLDNLTCSFPLKSRLKGSGMHKMTDILPYLNKLARQIKKKDTKSWLRNINSLSNSLRLFLNYDISLFLINSCWNLLHAKWQ